MAKHTEAAYKNPDVRYEREDIADAEVTYWAAGFAAVTVFGALFAVWVASSFVKVPAPGLALPPAAGDVSRRPPEPRLEALEDLEKGRPRLYPPRAVEHRASAEKGGEGVIPIEQAFKGMKFPSSGGAPAPAGTPNRAGAGRDVKGVEGK